MGRSSDLSPLTRPTTARSCSSAATMVLVLVLVVLVQTPPALAFNVDLPTALVHTGPEGSMFGFAVSQHRDRGFSWLLVGAPQAQTEQPGVNRGGAVFRCNTEVAGSCQTVPFDQLGSTETPVGRRLERSDDKSHQWFGATLQSSGEDGLIVACAPRYVYFSVNLRRREPVGTCFVSQSYFAGFQEYSPCRTSAWGVHRQGSCQAGFSAAITQDGRRLYMGAVGSWYWQGQVFSQDLAVRENHYNTSESPSEHDDSFLGYSTAVGEFSGDNDPDVAVGMPRGHELAGKVVLYDGRLKHLGNLTGEQMGSYFGYSVASADINGDGQDDLMVGAPLFTEEGLKDGSYERGRVYVYLQNPATHELERSSMLDGDQAKGRFGMALCSLGDLDHDGYQDFAVGAPYAGARSRGEVSVFLGGPQGVREGPSQVISAEDVRGALTTFGFSLAGGLDLDGNEYPDLLVGAYESDAAVYLRSRPVVDLETKLKVDGDNVALDDSTCSLRDGSRVPCFVVTVCLRYSGLGVAPTLGIIYELSLDSEPKGPPRAYLLEEEHTHSRNRSVRLTKDAQYCNSETAYVLKAIRDKLSPIRVRVRSSLVQTVSSQSLLLPVLNASRPSNVTHQVHIRKNCGGDGVCVPDLRLKATANMDEFLIGSTGNVELSVSIDNRGEDAFESMMYLRFPSDLSYVKVDKGKLDAVTCGGPQKQASGDSHLACDVQNPLPAGKKVRFKVLLAPAGPVPKASELNLTVVVNSTNPEVTEATGDNSVTLRLPVMVKVNMTARGTSFPPEVYLNASLIEDKEVQQAADIGPPVKHVYEVINRGPSVVREAEIYLVWPTHNIHGDPLLYLLEPPVLQGAGPNAKRRPCDVVSPRAPGEAVDPKRLAANSRRPRDADDSSGARIPRDASELELEDEVGCGDLPRCAVFRCFTGQLTAGERSVVTAESRLWQRTPASMGQEHMRISSKLVARVTRLLYDLPVTSIKHTVHFVSCPSFDVAQTRDISSTDTRELPS
ncbi:integrin alpha-PS2 [Ixodes scapularis]|uniref:integrin alpha-PS2 n=1 Tax=Ixodes scapularis TaxID=6945 RepID=UPI001A9E48FC|nr:integrin alpha-PS2 [Ixodes scapularis]